MTVSKETMIDLLGVMLKIRRFEEKLEEMVMAAKISGFVHLYIGQEAVAAGVCSNLRPTDSITSTHRGHGHLIAKGGDIKKMMAELFAKCRAFIFPPEEDFGQTVESRRGTELLETIITECHHAKGIDPWYITNADYSGILANHRANMAARIAGARYTLGLLITTLST